jgi:hypothetical protein
MTAKLRGRGEDSVYFDQANGCWVASVSLGFSVDSRRKRRTVRGRTKTEARDKLRQLREDVAAGVRAPAKYRHTNRGGRALIWDHVDLDGQPDADFSSRPVSRYGAPGSRAASSALGGFLMRLAHYRIS